MLGWSEPFLWPSICTGDFTLVLPLLVVEATFIFLEYSWDAFGCSRSSVLWLYVTELT